jgi:hypothetical protein
MSIRLGQCQILPGFQDGKLGLFSKLKGSTVLEISRRTTRGGWRRHLVEDAKALFVTLFGSSALLNFNPHGVLNLHEAG